MKVFGKERDYIIHDDENIKGFFGPYRFLSNFEDCKVEFEGLKYKNTEAAYQSAKYKDMGFREQQFIHLNASDAKKLGRLFEPTREEWSQIKFDVMAAVVFDKFYRNLYLRELLLKTGTKYLEESNHWGDTVWGVSKGIGENKLGRILMSVRTLFKY